MFRYYISYAFQGGFGNTDFKCSAPISHRDDLVAITEIIAKANNHQLRGLMITSFSLYAEKSAPQHSN